MVPAGLLSLGVPSAHADEAAARVLARVRDAYRAAPIHERLTIEVLAQDGSAEASEGSLHLDLRPESDRPFDLALGPIRAAVTADRLIILHATEPDRYVGVHLSSLSFDALSHMMPSLPLPQIAIALPDPDAVLSDDQIALDPLLPAITLREVARGPTTVTLAGRLGPAAATLTINHTTHRIERFEATIPAPSSWYELILTCDAVAHDPTAGIDPPDDLAPPSLPELSTRTRVDRVADLRPRGLVLVPGADLGWVPIALAPADPDQPTTLAGLLADLDAAAPATRLLLGVVELTDDGAWIDSARRTVELMRGVRPDGPSLLLVFDPAGRPSRSWPTARAALSDFDLGTTRLGWVDGRTLPLGRSLPRIDPAVIVLDVDGLIVGAVTAHADPTAAADDARTLGVAVGAAP